MAKNLKFIVKGKPALDVSDVIYLFLHRKLVQNCNTSLEIKRKEAMMIIKKHFNFKQGFMINYVVKDLIEKDLLLKVTRDKLKILNPGRSKSIEYICPSVLSKALPKSAGRPPD